jgi:hypothetical protein
MPNPRSLVLKELVAVRASLAPVAGSGSVQAGAWVDRTKFRSGVAVLAYSTSGGVTGGTITIKVEHATSAAGAGVADLTTIETVTLPAGPNASGVLEHGMNLEGANAFVRVSVDSDPTGGTPASIVAAHFVFSNPTNHPAV